ncbi:MAG: NADH-quinone oxidoreductase subunit C [Candidatus Hydrogenedentota bacterium]
MSAALFDSLKEKFGDATIEYVETASPYIAVQADAIHKVAAFLLKEGFDQLMCLSGVDTKTMKAVTKPLPKDAPKSTKPDVPPEQILVVYHLCRTSTGEKIALRVSLDREAPSVRTVSDVWKAANWHEREAFDMYGIVFEGHPDLTRILCPDDWIGYPLRKDYVFPTMYHDVPHARMPSGGELADHPEAAMNRDNKPEAAPAGKPHAH